jgi:hypothetical protein
LCNPVSVAAWAVFSTDTSLVEGSSAVPAAVSLGVPAEGVSLEGVSVEGVSAGGMPAGGVSAGGVSLEGVSVKGVSAGGVSAGGVSAGGVSAGGVSVGGVSVEGVSAGGMPAGGVSAGGVSAGDVRAGGVSVEGTSRVSALSVAVSLPEDFMSRCLRRYLNFLRDLLVPLCAPCIAKYDRLGPSLTELRRTLDPSACVGSSAGVDLGLQGGVVSGHGTSSTKMTGQESRLASPFTST